MEKIASFKVNHDILKKGMYISRIDRDIVTYDVRMKEPNKGDYLDNSSMHTFEHLFATYVRNTEFADSIIYVGPMGCRTGFYFIVRDEISHSDAIQIMKNTFNFIINFSSQIPGTNKIECGNYLEHDLVGAKKIAQDMKCVLQDWTVERLNYDE